MRIAVVKPLRERATGLVVSTAGLSAVICSLPLFLTGALAVNIREDIALGAAGLGAAVAIFRGVQMASVPLLGRFADAFGVVSSLRLCLTFTAVSSAGIVFLARDWLSFIFWLSIGALGKGLVTPAANRLLVHLVPPRRQGLAFGVKQSAAPAATMLGGISVPLVAETIGWRWAFLLLIGLVPLMIAVIGPRPPQPIGAERSRRRRPGRLDDRHTVLMMAGALFLGTSASSIIPVFWVDSSVSAGGSVQVAGILLAVASVGAILIRVVTGAACDRIARGHLKLAGALLGVGGLGLLGVASGDFRFMAPGVVVGMACGWGYPAVLWYAILRSYRDAPGQVTGAVSMGGLLGGSISPMVFGLAVEITDYGTAWLGVAAVSAVSALVMWFGNRRLERRRQKVSEGRGTRP